MVTLGQTLTSLIPSLQASWFGGHSATRMRDAILD